MKSLTAGETCKNTYITQNCSVPADVLAPLGHLQTWIWQCMPPVHVQIHCSNVTMGTMASPITSLAIVYSTFYSGTDQRKHQSSAPLAFVREIRRSPVNSPHKWLVTCKCGNKYKYLTFPRYLEGNGNPSPWMAYLYDINPVYWLQSRSLECLYPNIPFG